MNYVIWQKRPGQKPAAERGIVRELIAALIDSGHKVAVHDGEEWALKFSTSKTRVFDALAGTDSDTLVVKEAETGKPIGWVALVWGNSPWEVIADYAIDEDIIRPALDRAEDVTERFAVVLP